MITKPGDVKLIQGKEREKWRERREEKTREGKGKEGNKLLKNVLRHVERKICHQCVSHFCTSYEQGSSCFVPSDYLMNVCTVNNLVKKK